MLRCERVRTRSTTQVIRCGVRKKDSGPSNLREEVKKKEQTPRYFAYMGIIGRKGSGRRTLAYRLGHMKRPVIHERDVPTTYWYETTLEGPCHSRHRVYPSPPYLITLGIFIIPPPEELASRDVPLFWLLWNEYCCLLFAFDITNQSSFHWTTLKLSHFNQAEPGFHVPDCALVGNKSDRRDEIPENPDEDRPVSSFTASMEATHLDVPYFEVSARNIIDISLFIFIRRLAIDSLDL